MKKPKITEGEWVQFDYWIESDKQPKRKVALTANAHVSNEVKLANAKAISAVPNMLDVLLSINHAIENSRIDSGAILLGDRLEYRIRELLIKAGCHENK